jgi:hypothetical protein
MGRTARVSKSGPKQAAAGARSSCLSIQPRPKERKADGGAGISVHDKLSVVFKLLIECLEANKALRPGQFQKALRATIGHPKAEPHRLDYVLLAELLKQLEASSGERRQ